jgi:hypothetical protein
MVKGRCVRMLGDEKIDEERMMDLRIYRYKVVW